MLRSRGQPRVLGDQAQPSSATPPHLSRRRFCGGTLAAMVLGGATGAALAAGCSNDDTPPDATSDATSTRSGRPVMYSSPTCGCCGNYADYLRSNGHDVEVRHQDDLTEIKDEAGIPEDARGCHTTLIGDYAIEGHVPIEAIEKLLDEQPTLDGIALPGMPAGSPGMSGTKDGPFEILSIKNGALDSYMTI